MLLNNNDSGFHVSIWADEKLGTGVRYLIKNTKPMGKCPIQWQNLRKRSKFPNRFTLSHTFSCFFVKTNAARKGLGANAGRAQLKRHGMGVCPFVRGNPLHGSSERPSFWANYSDISRRHPKQWFNKGVPKKSPSAEATKIDDPANVSIPLQVWSCTKESMCLHRG